MYLRADPGHDGVDVHAAAAPGGLSAAAATGGTTHVVLLRLSVNELLTLGINIPLWVLFMVPNAGNSSQRTPCAGPVAPSAEAQVPAGPSIRILVAGQPG